MDASCNPVPQLEGWILESRAEGDEGPGTVAPDDGARRAILRNVLPIGRVLGTGKIQG